MKKLLLIAFILISQNIFQASANYIQTGNNNGNEINSPLVGINIDFLIQIIKDFANYDEETSDVVISYEDVIHHLNLYIEQGNSLTATREDDNATLLIVLAKLAALATDEKKAELKELFIHLIGLEDQDGNKINKDAQDKDNLKALDYLQQRQNEDTEYFNELIELLN